MRMREFIRKHRGDIDSIIQQETSSKTKIKNDEERQEYILNIEVLYRWAKYEGVKI